MKDELAITFKLSKEELEIIKKCSNLLGIGHTTFCRQSALEKARINIKSLS